MGCEFRIDGFLDEWMGREKTPPHVVAYKGFQLEVLVYGHRRRVDDGSFKRPMFFRFRPDFGLGSKL